MLSVTGVGRAGDEPPSAPALRGGLVTWPRVSTNDRRPRPVTPSTAGRGCDRRTPPRAEWVHAREKLCRDINKKKFIVRGKRERFTWNVFRFLFDFGIRICSVDLFVIVLQQSKVLKTKPNLNSTDSYSTKISNTVKAYKTPSSNVHKLF